LCSLFLNCCFKSVPLFCCAHSVHCWTNLLSLINLWLDTNWQIQTKLLWSPKLNFFGELNTHLGGGSDLLGRNFPLAWKNFPWFEMACSSQDFLIQYYLPPEKEFIPTTIIMFLLHRTLL
jgi:hypothetical protein